MYLREMKNIDTVLNYIDDLNRGFRLVSAKKDGVGFLSVDIKEDEESYIVLLDIPGVDKENVSATLKNGLLTVDVDNQKEDVESNSDKYLVKERVSFKKLKRVLDFKDTVGNDVNAKIENGVLTLVLKKVKVEDTELKIEIN